MECEDRLGAVCVCLLKTLFQICFFLFCFGDAVERAHLESRYGTVCINYIYGDIDAPCSECIWGWGGGRSQLSPVRVRSLTEIPESSYMCTPLR